MVEWNDMDQCEIEHDDGSMRLINEIMNDHRERDLSQAVQMHNKQTEKSRSCYKYACVCINALASLLSCHLCHFYI